MGKHNKKKQKGNSTTSEASKPVITKNDKAVKPSSHGSSNNSSSSTSLLPLPFPHHMPRPSNDFLRNEDPYQESFQSALTTSYEGFVVDNDDAFVGDNTETKIQEALNDMLDRNFFRRDVTQPFGLGTKCAKTYVTRCLVGEPGTTYKYLGLRMFAHPWSSISEIHALGTNILVQRTQHHLAELTKTRLGRGAPPTRGRPDFDICLINRMEASEDLKAEPSIGNAHKTSVSWHADSSLEHYSTIAVYQTLVPTPSDDAETSKKKKHRDDKKNGKWFVALRVAHNSEGPQASRRGTDIDSSIVKETPPIAVSLPSGSAYYLLDDFNHHHQHTVLTNADSGTGAGVRFSCTFRLLRDSHNVNYMIQRCSSVCSSFHKKGSKLWRCEQLLLTELESEWIRQFYIQGSQHQELLWASWKEPIEQLLCYWSQLEGRTNQTISFLRAAAEGRCGMGTTSSASEQVPSKAERKARDRRKKALVSLEALLERSSAEEKDAMKSIYEPLAELMEQRAELRDLWSKREKDHVFHQLGQDCRPLSVPFQFERLVDEKVTGENGSSPLPGSPFALREIASSLRALGKAYMTGNTKDLPATEVTGAETSRSNHSKALDWPGWSQHDYGLELQHPWAGAVVDGRKAIETRSYDLPPSLLGKRVMILQSPAGAAGVSAMGDFVNFSDFEGEVIGWCTFHSIKKYTSQEEFEADEGSHLVSPDSGYGWTKDATKTIYGWVVGECGRFESDVKGFHSAVRRMRSLFQLRVQEGSEQGGSSRAQKKQSRSGENKQRKKRRKRF